MRSSILLIMSCIIVFTAAEPAEKMLTCTKSPLQPKIAGCTGQDLPPRQFIIRDTRCPSGWTFFEKSKSCYHVGTRKTFSNAQAECYSLDSNLTSIHTPEENKFLAALTATWLKMGPEDQTWIGFQYDEDDNEWKWIDGSIVGYTHWKFEKLEHVKEGFACAQLLSDEYNVIHPTMKRLEWNNAYCGQRMRKFVCKKPASPDYS